MLKRERLCRAALLLVLPTALLLSGGCDKQESSAPNPAPSTPSPATQPSAAAPAGGTVAGDAGMSALADEARRASQTQPAMPDRMPALPDRLPGLPGPGDAAAASPAPAPGASATPGASDTTPSSPAGEKTAEAQKLLDQAMQYVKENKYDLAEKALGQLDGMKASLPAEWAPRIDSARKALTAAKAGGGVKLPEGIPGLK